MSSSGSILIVDDDSDVRALLDEYLSAQGFEISEAASGEQMRARLSARVPDVVLLDLNLPGEDGLSLARYLRERHEVGIIMVTAAGTLVDRIVGLEVGADDYVAKPFDLRELLARVKSVMRRVRTARAPRDAQPNATCVPMGRCTLDLARHALVSADGKDVPMTHMEFDLLRVFAQHPNQVLSRDRLLTLTREREWEPFDRSIDIRVARVRRKIEADPENPEVIRTVRGAGYMFVPRGQG